jgi:Fe2+ or Zn2+ uptake regulation protein
MINLNGELKGALEKNGQKITKARTVIFELLKKSQKPLSAQEIQKKFTDFDRVTIYRTLEQFSRLGIVSKLALGGDRAYFEYAPVHHHHIVCKNCGTIEELSECLAPKNMSISKKTKKFAKISHHSLEFFGTCTSCHNRH